MPVGVYALRWADVDPAVHEFDPSLARTAVLDVVSQAVGGRLDRNKPGGVSRAQIQYDVTTALFAAYGAWIAGWSWAASEPGGGGPIRSYCCADDSIFRKGDAGALPTIDRIVASATEWRMFLEELAVVFGELRRDTAGFDLPHRVEHAAARLVALVVTRTTAEDAWYGTFAKLLCWFLEFCGEELSSDRVVMAVVRGHFHSWTQPHPDAIATCARELGNAVTQRETRDALPAWLKAREITFARALQHVPSQPVRRDAHREFIETRDRARDAERADRMLAALAECRASAQRQEPLTFDLLASWQRLVLGLAEPPGWRTTDAFARHVRYGYSPYLPARFDAALAQANSDEEAASRAARVYLDVAFFHPFDDGNARAARLAMEHVLARAGLRLHAYEPLVVVARATDDWEGAFALAQMIDQLASRP